MRLTRLAIQRPLTILMASLALVQMGGVAYAYLHFDRLLPVRIGKLESAERVGQSAGRPASSLAPPCFWHQASAARGSLLALVCGGLTFFELA